MVLDFDFDPNRSLIMINSKLIASSIEMKAHHYFRLALIYFCREYLELHFLDSLNEFLFFYENHNFYDIYTNMHGTCIKYRKSCLIRFYNILEFLNINFSYILSRSFSFDSSKYISFYNNTLYFSKYCFTTNISIMRSSKSAYKRLTVQKIFIDRSIKHGLLCR